MRLQMRGAWERCQGRAPQLQTRQAAEMPELLLLLLLLALRVLEQQLLVPGAAWKPR